MKYIDRVYGKVEITESAILELIESPTLQRLKGIDQAGHRPLWVKPNIKVGRYDHSRFSHSIGVYLLLRKYNAPFPEQIAGLIHDVSHSAFSHAGDYIFNEGSQKEHSHQDNIFEEYVRNSEIPGILEKYKFDLEYILDDKNFPLKENQLPDLCADRIDYSLRTAVVFGELSEGDKNYILGNLMAEGKQWIFKNYESGQKYADLFFRLNEIYYSGFSSALMFKVTGDLLRYAWEKKYISQDEIYTTDEIVLDKIKNFLPEDDHLGLLWKRMSGEIKTENKKEEGSARVFCKSRIVDPLCKVGGKIKRVSDINSEWKKVLEEEMKPKEYFIKFL